MSVAVVGKLIEMVKQIADLSKTVIEASDPEKYAKGVEALNSGVSQTYDQMRSVIVNSNKFSDEEKLERLQELALQEQASKQKCSEAINGNREQVAKIAMEVVTGLLTCGISFVPEIAKRLKISLSDSGVETICNTNNPMIMGESVVRSESDT
jgi:ATP-dependent DNA ligase